MAILKVKTYPDEVLAKRSAEVELLRPEDLEFIKDLIETMFQSDGVGMAAPQVGVSKRIIVISPEAKKGKEKVYINPEILLQSGTQLKEEGCLSVPGVTAEVRRAKTVKIRARDLEWKETVFEAENLEARILQHEIDHLDGKLFIDRLGFNQRREILPGLKMLRSKS
ncbi:MAG TPA: peptide deformylase [Candidatus Omnitrophota bacterium]|nr:peptide deformylase [Candidatus Omnitrophota bacterium]